MYYILPLPNNYINIFLIINYIQFTDESYNLHRYLWLKSYF